MQRRTPLLVAKSVAGCVVAVVLLWWGSAALPCWIMAPREEGRVWSNQELRSVVRANRDLLDEVKKSVLADGVSDALDVVLGVGAIDLDIAIDASRELQSVNIVFYREFAMTGTYQVSLEWVAHDVARTRRTLPDSQDKYVECERGWWIVRW